MTIDWDMIFAATNLLAVAGWLALAALPRRESVLNGVLYGAIGILCAIYLTLFVGSFGGMIDPARDGSGSVPPFEYTVDGLKTMFAARGAIVIGWTHYLAFDLFVGLWIARDADKRGVARLAQLPFLAATFLAGPIGLLTWLLGRRPLSRS